jgi:hypothetical protein
MMSLSQLKKITYLAFILSIVFTINACDTFNPENEIPSYLHINKINFSTDFPVEGSSSHKITDAWIYIDDQKIGVFELPTTVPILLSGQHNLKVFAGVKMNGISATHIDYPFYEVFSKTVNLELTKVDTIEPSVNYYSTVKFPLLESFEDVGVKFEKLSGSDTNIVRVSDPSLVFEGAYSGAIFLDSQKQLARIGSQQSSLLMLPKNSKPVFLEMNYKNNQHFNIGIVASYGTFTDESTIITINPSENWNKIYINLTESINKFPSAFGYYLVITALKDPALSNSSIFLDNLKIVHQ